MGTHVVTFLALLQTFTFIGLGAATPMDADTARHPLAGSWQGTLEAGGARLRLIINLKGAAGEGLAATIDSPDQGAMGIPVDSVVFDKASIRVVLTQLGAMYEGTVNDSLTGMSGFWRQSGMSFPLALYRIAKPLTLKRPQEPKPPFPYRSEEVRVRNDRASDTLAGTLTAPNGAGPFPAVVLITGSGPQDRNEELFGHKPFLVLSDYLTRHGIAVLRCDDRGIGKSTGDFATATSADFADDARACVGFLKTRPEVDRRKIGLIGHSEGGMIAPMVADGDTDVAFVVLMAGPGVNGEQILYLQGALIAKASGANDSAVTEQRAIQERLFTAIKRDNDTTALQRDLASIFDEQLNRVPQEQRQAASRGFTAEIRRLSSPWFRYFLTFEPAPVLERITCPVLAINGDKDLQVSSTQNLPAIRKAMVNNPNATIRELAGLNHLFQHAKTGLMNEYVESEETIAPEALSLIGDWILEVTK